jgi:hypothetical protein
MWSYHRTKGDEEEGNLRLRLICGPRDMMKGTDASSSNTIASLLTRWAESVLAGSSIHNSSLLLSVNGEQFKLWLSPISDDSDILFEDLVDRATDFLLQPRSYSACFSFRLELFNEKNSTSPDVYLLSILNISAGDRSYPAAICWSAASHVLRRHVMKKLRQGASWILFLLLLVIVLFLGIGIMTSLQITFRGSDLDNSEAGLWLTWNTSHSTGLEHQLQFTKPWSRFVEYFDEETIHQPWFVRLDDQSMVTPDLIDDTEMKYQRWFRERYPEMEKIRLSGDYLNESFWLDPDSVRIVTDPLFHPAHCLLALRRYWLAKETGQHVCPRDIDYHHVKHCLDSLDDVFFVDLQKMPIVTLEDSDNRMPWLVNACF